MATKLAEIFQFKEEYKYTFKNILLSVQTFKIVIVIFCNFNCYVL